MRPTIVGQAVHKRNCWVVDGHEWTDLHIVIRVPESGMPPGGRGAGDLEMSEWEIMCRTAARRTGPDPGRAARAAVTVAAAVALRRRSQ